MRKQVFSVSSVISVVKGFGPGQENLSPQRSQRTPRKAEFKSGFLASVAMTVIVF
jgi:hypothetical protein